MASEFASFNLNEYPVIVIEDKGDYWWASQEALQPTSGFGGGQLYMRIDKCTGAISHAAYNK